MTKYSESTPFADLIRHCADRTSPDYDAAWREFVRRYHGHIGGAVANRCLNWKSDRLGRQLSDVIEDIIAEVYIILQKKLHTYRVGDGDKAFPYWLGTICNREAGSYLKRQMKDRERLNPHQYQMDQVAAKTPGHYFSEMEFFEEIVQQLRNSRKNISRNLDTQMHIFLLLTMFDIEEEHLLDGHPLLKNLTADMMKNIKHRSREALRKNRNKGPGSKK